MKSKLFALLLVIFALTGCAAEKAEPTKVTPITQKEGGADLECVEYSSFSGTFPEDGSGRKVTDVAAMLVRNNTDKFLDTALVEVAIGNATGTFMVTGLPAGASVWVLEQSGMKISAGDNFEITDCRDYAFREDAVTETDRLKVTYDGATVKVENVSADVMHNVCIYYKEKHSEDTYFGGITYMLAFDTLEPGGSLTKASNHFGSDMEIVRYSFQID